MLCGRLFWRLLILCLWGYLLYTLFRVDVSGGCGGGVRVSGVYRVAKGGTVVNGGISRSGEEAGEAFSLGLFGGGFCCMRRSY